MNERPILDWSYIPPLARPSLGLRISAIRVLMPIMLFLAAFALPLLEDRCVERRWGGFGQMRALALVDVRAEARLSMWQGELRVQL